MLLCLETAAEVPCFFKNFTVGLSPKKKDCANFSHALLSVLSTLGYAGLGLAPHSPVQSLVWPHTVRFDTSYLNLGQPHIFKHQM